MRLGAQGIPGLGHRGAEAYGSAMVVNRTWGLCARGFFTGDPRAMTAIVGGLFVAAVLGGCTRTARPRAPHPASGYCSVQFQASIGWPEPQDAASVCACESSGNPRATSRNGLYLGLFQFSRDTWQTVGSGDVFDPYANSAAALRLWQRRGWKPWPHCGR